MFFPRAYTADTGRITLIARSYRRLLGTPLYNRAVDELDALWEHPAVILAHDTAPDPRFFFANRAALERFEATPEQLIGSPSRLSAEAPLRGERQALLDRVARDGFIADYAGVRISARGRRFRIEHAVVWNLIDEAGDIHGQAAAFSRWTEL